MEGMFLGRKRHVAEIMRAKLCEGKPHQKAALGEKNG
ncbi:hypothetical protein T11_10913 [Trichinella zimbabwensis]|uniref:Uncharacterized protein n=1 Tax=Trichinella zimbabwensis TaxID=268475 RepID=A0A0V1GAQ0_9BILA|nr:hypothetical protein T11_10913 [Trichinella zimbabwensis]